MEYNLLSEVPEDIQKIIEAEPFQYLGDEPGASQCKNKTRELDAFCQWERWNVGRPIANN